MSDSKSVLCAYMTSGAGRKMLQESAEEIIRDFVEQQPTLLAKTIAGLLPTTGKFGAELEKIKDFNFRAFSQALADMGKEWINPLPIDRDVKIILGQIVDGVIGSGKR